MKRLWYVFIPILTVQVYLAYFQDEGPAQFRRMPRDGITPSPQARDTEASAPRGRTGKVLRPQSQLDPSFTVKIGEKSNSTGTAFSIRQDGVWFTARHVVDGCDHIGLQVDQRRATKVHKIEVHPKADIAVLWTRSGNPSIGLTSQNLRLNQPGFHVGYPEGNPGQVVSSLIGRRNMRTVGRYRQSEPVVAWVERARHPRTQSLGGLSGGPALDAAGEVIGVTVAASKRRGRVFTTARATMNDMLNYANIRPDGTPSGGLGIRPNDDDYVRYGDKLRSEKIVAKVLCLIDRPARRRTSTRGF
ncbi:MAG: serine protease [Pseudomonadota bacterium]|nr:serine protease [Pseudomonadota bacterium]